MATRLAQQLGEGRTALLLSEVQAGVIGAQAPWPALADAAAEVGLIANAARLAEAARQRGVPVIHCTARNLDGFFGTNSNARLFAGARKVRPAGSETAPGDAPHPDVWRDGDILLPRFHGLSAMTGSPLDSLLRNEGVDTLVIGGVSLAFGVLSLVMDAVNRAYRVIVAEDAVAGVPEAYARQVLEHTIGMLALVSPTDAILSAWEAAPAPAAAT